MGISQNLIVHDKGSFWKEGDTLVDSLVDILNLHGGKWQMTATTPLALGLTVPATLIER